MEASRNLFDRYGAGTASLVVHGAVVGVMLVLFEAVPKSPVVTMAITMPTPTLEETQDVPESTDVVNAAPPPPMEAPPTEKPVDPNEEPVPEAAVEPPKPLEEPPPVTSTAPEATPAVAPPPDTIVAKEPTPAPQVVQRPPRPAPPAPRKPDPQPNTAPQDDAKAPPAPQLARAARSGSPGARSTYLGLLQARLQRNQIYPRDLRRGEHGTVLVAFTIDRTGHVLASGIVRGSGHPRLDEEALATLRRSDPLPAPPEDVPGSQIQLTVPMNFTMPR